MELNKMISARTNWRRRKISAIYFFLTPFHVCLCLCLFLFRQDLRKLLCVKHLCVCLFACVCVRARAYVCMRESARVRACLSARTRPQPSPLSPVVAQTEANYQRTWQGRSSRSTDAGGRRLISSFFLWRCIFLVPAWLSSAVPSSLFSTACCSSILLAFLSAVPHAD